MSCTGDESNDSTTTNPMDQTIDGTPFSVLLSQAAKLKTAQSATYREQFDRFPKFYQNSLFHSPKTVSWASVTFSDQMELAVALKLNGNAAFKKSHFRDALSNYEKAIAVWNYLENVNPKWKSEGIKDCDIRERKYQWKTNQEKQLVTSFLISCYTNISIAALNTKEYELSRSACDSALNVNANCSKALYLRAKTRVTPLSCGSADQDAALNDLRLAQSLDPQNSSIKKEINKLRTLIREQRERDKQSYFGFFQKGGTISSKDDSDNISSSNEQQMKLSQTEDEIKYTSSSIKQHHDQILQTDFRNPSPSAIAEAERRGIDLNDPLVVDVLEQMELDKRKGNIHDCIGNGQARRTHPKAIGSDKHGFLKTWCILFLCFVGLRLIIRTFITRGWL